jgi:hypothetical protein
VDLIIATSAIPSNMSYRRSIRSVFVELKTRGGISLAQPQGVSNDFDPCVFWFRARMARETNLIVSGSTAQEIV